MNLCDCYVTEILGEPYEAYGRWWVKVRYDAWGNISTSDVMFNSKDEALKVGVGFHFLA